MSKGIYSLMNRWLQPMSLALRRVFQRGDLLAIFMLAVSVRLIVLAISNNQLGAYHVLDKCFDCRLYYISAKAFASGLPIPPNALFYFGPGYVCFLGSVMTLTGNYLLVALITNIFISGIGCLLIYKLARILTGSYGVAIVAGIISSLSYTSITLSCMTMSDTFYFSLMAAILVLFFKGLKSGKWVLYIVTGVLLGYSILTRSVGQFFPFALAIIALLYIKYSKSENIPFPHTIRLIYKKLIVLILVAACFPAFWVIRNNNIYGTPFLSIAGALGPANVAAVTIEKKTGKYSKETISEWVDESLMGQGAYGPVYNQYLGHAYNTFDSLGTEMILTYLSVLWENLNEFNFQHRILTPEYDTFMIPLEHTIKDNGLNYIPLILVIWGLAALIFKREYIIAVILCIIFLYFISMIGAFRWQGARYSFPAYISGFILIANGIVYLLKLTASALGNLFKWYQQQIENE